MSRNLFDFGVRLHANQQKRAVQVSELRRVNIRKDALVIAVIGMSGEHAGLWSVAVGERHAHKPQVFRCGDPSFYPLQVEMWEELERVVSGHIHKSLERGISPQFVVANRKSWDLLAETAGRMSGATKSVAAKRLARYLMYANRRFFLDGDPTVVTLAELLSTTYVCGHEQKYDMNLQSTLSWIAGEPIDVENSFVVDDDCFLPRDIEDKKMADKFIRMKSTQQRVSGSETSLSDMKNSASYTVALNPYAKERWERLRSAALIYQETPLGIADEIEGFAEMAMSGWEHFVTRNESLEAQEAQRELGFEETSEEENNAANFELLAEGSVTKTIRGESRYDSVRDANDKLAERNDYADQWARTLVWRDGYERQRAFANGEIVEGVVVATENENGSFTADVLVAHDMLRIRKGDELTAFADKKVLVAVHSLEKTSDGDTLVKIVGDPSPTKGDVVAYGPRCPAPKEIVAKAARRRKRLSRSGWTHSVYKEPPQDKLGEAPDGILDKVNKARAQ